MARKIGIVIYCAAILAGVGYAAVLLIDGDPATPESANASLPPSPEEAVANATPASAEEVAAAERAGAQIRAKVKADPSAIPPASAGNNGSYKPPPPGERRRIGTKSHLPDGTDPDDAALLLGDTAIPPPNAPAEIQSFIAAANQIVGQPYKWGGGHGSFRSQGYDCSGAVSYGLAGAGLLGAPATSGQLTGWGKPGQGRWLTLYAKGSHVYAVVGGLRWDTVGNANGTGPRWQPLAAYPSGYEVRHFPGL